MKLEVLTFSTRIPPFKTLGINFWPNSIQHPLEYKLFWGHILLYLSLYSRPSTIPGLWSRNVFGWMNESPKCFFRALIASLYSGESLVVTSNLSPLIVNGPWSPPNVSHIFTLSFSSLDIELCVTHIFNQDIKQIPKEKNLFNLCGKCAFSC